MTKQVVSVFTKDINIMATPTQQSLLQTLRINLFQLYLEESALLKLPRRTSLVDMLRCDNPSLEAVLKFLDAYPQSVSELEELGGNALHCACRNQCSSEVVSALVRAMPEGLDRKDVYGELPLHLAIQNNYDMEVIREMAYLYPESLHIRNGDHELPLNLSILSDASQDVVLFLMEQYPEALKLKDSIGDLPLHSILSRRTTFNMVRRFVDAYPDALYAKGVNGYRPLHTAAMTANPTIVDYLIQACPPAASEIDDDGNLPLHYAVSESSSLSVAQLLVRANPESVCFHGAQGLVPLDLAYACNSSPDLIQFLQEVSYQRTN
jgi:ankyrin repeat protein